MMCCKKTCESVYTLRDLVEGSRKYKDSMIYCNGESISYEAVHIDSDRIANALVPLIHTGEVVGLRMSKSPRLYVALLGIVKAGGCFFYQNPEDISERNAKMSREAGCMYEITDDSYGELLIAGDRSEVDYKTVLLSEKDFCGILYTSGSTGSPKGIRFTHGGIVNLLCYLLPIVYNESNHCGHHIFFSPLSFIFGVQSFFLALSAGANIYTLPSVGELEMVIKNSISSEKRCVLDCTPSMIRQFMEDDLVRSFLKCCAVLVLAGEKLDSDTVEKILALMDQNSGIFTLYGSTETLGAAQTMYYKKDGTIITKIADGVQTTIRDKQNRILSSGEKGEICVHGIRVSAGYIDQTIPDQKLFEQEQDGFYTYHTRDEGILNPDGTFTVIGRMDNVLKISGMRIDPSEVENALQKHPNIQSCAVKGIKVKGKTRLAAFYTGDSKLEKRGLISWMMQKLSRTMVPSFFVYMDKLPLNERGKTDYKALVIPESGPKEAEDICDTKEKQVLRKIACKILHKNDIRSSANLLQEGLDSLGCMSLIAALRKEGYELSAGEVFLTPWISDLAAKLRMVEEQEQAVPDDFDLLLTDEMKGWIDNFMKKDFVKGAYLTSVIHLKHELDEGLFRSRIQTIVSSHPVLKAVIRKEQNVLSAEIRKDSVPEIEIRDISRYKKKTQENFIHAYHQAVYRDDTIKEQLLSKPVRFVLFQRGKDLASIMLCLPHFMADGISVKKLQEELEHGVPDQGTDGYYGYVRYCSDPVTREKDRAYWKEKLSEAEHITLPLNPSYTGNEDPKLHKIVLTERETGKLIQYCRRKGHSLYALVLNCYAQGYMDAVQANRITLNVKVSGRNIPVKGMEAAVGNMIREIPLVIRREDTPYTIQQKVAEGETHISLDEKEIWEGVYGKKIRPYVVPGIVSELYGSVEQADEDTKADDQRFDLIMGSFLEIQQNQLSLQIVADMDLWDHNAVDRWIRAISDRLKQYAELPLVSVIVPVYNGEKYIEKCIDQLLQQTYPNMEIIAVNDGSTDHTEEKLKELCGKVPGFKYVTHEKNKGLYIARLTGFQASEGAYISYLDVDDKLSEDFLESLVKEIRTSDSEIAMGKAIIVDGKGNEWIDKRSENYGHKYLEQDEIIHAYWQSAGKNPLFMSLCYKIYKRTLIERTLPELKAVTTRINYAEDFLAFSFIIMHASKIVFAEKGRYYYIRNNDSVTNTTSKDRKVRKKVEDSHYVLSSLRLLLVEKAAGEVIWDGFSRWSEMIMANCYEDLKKSELEQEEEAQIRSLICDFLPDPDQASLMEYYPVIVPAKTRKEENR